MNLVGKVLRGGGLLLVLLLAAGCYEQTMNVKLKKDGSGTVQVRVLMSPQMTRGARYFSILSGRRMTPRLPAKMFDREVMEAKAATLGKGVEFVRGREVQHNGWSGFYTEYAFEDINQLRLTTRMNFANLDSATLRDKAPNVAYRFTYRIVEGVPTLDVKTTTEAGENPETTAPTEEMPEIPESLKQDLERMRVAVYLSYPEGALVQTNSNFRLQRNFATVALLDLNFSQFAENPAVFQDVLEHDVQALAEASNQGIAGINVEDPGKTLTMQYR